MVSTVATSMPGLALAGESLGNTDLPANPVAEQMAEVSGSPDSEWYQAPLEFFSGIKSARYESKVGDYDLRVDALNTQVRVKPKVKLDEAGLKVSGRLDLANTQLTRSFESGGWNITQGGYARLRLEGEVGGSISKEAGSSEYLDHGVLLQGGLFRRWETSLSDTTTFKVQTELGLHHNFTQNDSTAFLGASQELRGESELAGYDFNWSLQSRQRISYSTAREDSTVAQIEVFAGVGKDFPLQVFGRKADIRAEVGPRAQLDSLGAFKVAPAARLKVRF